jgi:hypothetical protein
MSTLPPAFPTQAHSVEPSPQRVAVGPPVVRRSTSRLIRDVLQSVALIIAAMWGAYTFFYREIIIPARRPAALVVTPSLEAIGRHGDTVLAKATFVLVNHSDSKVFAPAIWYSVRGLKLQPVATEDTAYLRGNRENADKPYPTARFSQFTAADVIGEGKINGEVEYWFDPGGEQRVEQILYIPADRYDAAQLSVQYLVTKDIHELKQVRWTTTDDGELNPRLVFAAGSPYAGPPAELSDTVPRYVRWLKGHQGGVNFVSATMSLWRSGPSAPSPQPAP